jgi:predicted nicotinamide N-methyase
MPIPCNLQSFSIGNRQIEIFVPEPVMVQQYYHDNKKAAYWAQAWPASIGLCMFLSEHPAYISGKNILELAAGIGLPGLYAAATANKVHITDIEPQAMDCVQQSIKHIQLNNVSSAALDWKDAANLPLPGILLLSDVNYEPAVFATLQQVLEYFLQHQVTIIISTPQRLVAKEFVNHLLPYCIQQWNTNVLMNDKETDISVFVLQSF